MTNGPVWVSLIEVSYLHELGILMAGGAPDLLDKNVLESALANPRNLYHYGAADLFELAACYAESIVRNHPFVDGNKRTAFLTAVHFLDLNGLELGNARSARHHTIIVDLVNKVISRKELAEHFRRQCKKK